MSKLEQVMQDINRKYKQELIQKGTERIYVEKIPFNSPRANYITYGGVPLGKGTEFLGPEGGGKTTTAIDIVASSQVQVKKELSKEIKDNEAEIKSLEKATLKRDKERVKELTERNAYLKQRGPRQVIYVDTENTLDEEWAELNGVNTEELILMRPNEHTAEQVLQIMYDLLETGEVYLMVLDSIPMLISQKLYEEDVEKRAYGGIADAMARFVGKVSPVISKHRTALVMINQIRDDLDNPFNQWHTSGGRALKHFYGLRLGFRKGSLLDKDNNEVPNRTEDPAGNRVGMTIVKTKVCKPDRRLGYYTLNYTNGIDTIEDTIDMAVMYNILVQRGAWFQFIDPETGEVLKDKEGTELKFQGKARLLNYLREDKDAYNKLWEEVNTKLMEE